MKPFRARIQPVEQQFDVSSRYHVDTWSAQRRPLEFGPLGTPHFHPHL